MSQFILNNAGIPCFLVLNATCVVCIFNAHICTKYFVVIYLCFSRFFSSLSIMHSIQYTRLLSLPVQFISFFVSSENKIVFQFQCVNEGPSWGNGYKKFKNFGIKNTKSRKWIGHRFCTCLVIVSNLAFDFCS